MMDHLIFLIDDELTAREGIALALSNTYRVQAFPNAEEALQAMAEEPPDLVLLDIGLPGMSGVEALERMKSMFPALLVIMITAYEDVKTVVSAMKLGAHDYIVKPLQMDALHISVRNALENLAMRREIQHLHEGFLKEDTPCFIGESNIIQDIMAIVDKVALSPDTSILIQGETGTGKELLARAIHYRSPNYSGPLVSVNCAAIPNELIESELFGYEKGAFSGAHTSGKQGLVEKAAGGTLFLDEVGDLSLEAQAKILRFLEEGEYYRVGGSKKRKIKTRVLAATNKDLLTMIDEGLFREDLYYRLAVIRVEAPALNQRRNDIPLIARHFLDLFCRKFNKKITGFSPDAEQSLKQYNWKGNVRELRNVIERSVLLSDGPLISGHDIGLNGSRSAGTEVVSASDLPVLTEDGIDLPGLLERIEIRYFEQALEIGRNNESRAAQLLNMSRDTFRYRRKNKNSTAT